jgi:SEC-C motif
VRARYFRPGRTLVRPWYERNADRFSSDRALVAKFYPSLEFRINAEKDTAFLEGDMILRADCGIPTEIETVVRFPWDYPGSEPVPFDAGKRFQPAPGKLLTDRHIGPDGQCCLWLPPCSLWDSANPEGLREFLDELAVFFDRQLIYDLTRRWPGPSYGHGTNGYLEFIQERLGNDVRLSDVLTPVITMQTEVGPNAPCPCGSGKKFKKCHRHVSERIQGQIGVGRLRRIFGTSRN